MPGCVAGKWSVMAGEGSGAMVLGLGSARPRPFPAKERGSIPEANTLGILICIRQATKRMGRGGANIGARSSSHGRRHDGVGPTTMTKERAAKGFKALRCEWECAVAYGGWGPP
jgi:hypothetical protein